LFEIQILKLGIYWKYENFIFLRSILCMRIRGHKFSTKLLWNIYIIAVIIILITYIGLCIGLQGKPYLNLIIYESYFITTFLSIIGVVSVLCTFVLIFYFRNIETAMHPIYARTKQITFLMVYSNLAILSKLFFSNFYFDTHERLLG